MEYEFEGLLEMIKLQVSQMNESECIKAINHIKKEIDKINPIKQPVSVTHWVPAEKVIGNDYNPNHVAPPEMKLLHRSVQADGFTQPIVCYHDKEHDIYIVVDGYHREQLGSKYPDIKKEIKGYLPITIIDKPLEERMASTIRHNRARGKHEINQMSSIVAALYKNGWEDDKIAKELGMDFDEVLRLKQHTGIAEIFKDVDYSRAWE